MHWRVVTLALLLPAVLPAQTPIRLPPGGCAWEARTDAVWGASVRGFSSQYNTSSWAATQALGTPNVWPRYGDLTGAWAPSSAANLADYLEIMFPQPVTANEVWVFETNGAGGVYAVGAINPDGSVAPLAVATPERLPRAATQIVVPVEPARLVAGVRIGVSSGAADDYGEVDAVAAVPARACSGSGEFSAAASAMRLPPSAVPDPAPAGVVWARDVAERSSEGDARDRAAVQALGAPNVFPRYADMPGAWAPSSSDSRLESVVLRFPPTAAREILVYETYGVGGVWMVQDMSTGRPVAIWADAPGPVTPVEARQLRIVLPRPRTISALRVVSSPRVVDAYPMVDAVGLVPATAGAEARPKPLGDDAPPRVSEGDRW